MEEIRIVKTIVTREELANIAEKQFGSLVKAVVDVRQKIMAIGGALHADEEALLTEREGSRREDTWGINLYPESKGEKFLEFDSMVNLKPAFGNRSRNVDDPAIQERIKEIVARLVTG